MLRLPLYDAYPIDDLVLPLGELTWRRSNLDPIEQVTLLALIALRAPRRIFEIGTYDGSTTRRLAAAAPAARVWTLDLSPELAGASTETGTRDHAAAGLVGNAFRNTPEATRITQIFSDSRLFAPEELGGTMDLVIVDAGHELEFVRADTRTALTLRSPDGVIVWDDYEDYWPDVQAGVDELPPEILADCVHIANSGLAVYDPLRRAGALREPRG